jgi:hypothetical protein
MLNFASAYTKCKRAKRAMSGSMAISASSGYSRESDPKLWSNYVNDPLLWAIEVK